MLAVLASGEAPCGCAPLRVSHPLRSALGSTLRVGNRAEGRSAGGIKLGTFEVGSAHGMDTRARQRAGAGRVQRLAAVGWRSELHRGAYAGRS